MEGMKKLAIPVLCFLLLLTTVSAVTFSVRIKEVKKDIQPDEIAIFNITIKNIDTEPDFYYVYTTDVRWSIDVEPELRTIEPGESQTFELHMIPAKDTLIGPQRVQIIIESAASGNKRFNQLPIYLQPYSRTPRDYEPSIEMHVTMPETFDPRASLPVEVSLRNRNNLNMDELSLTIQTKLFQKKDIFPFKGLEEKSKEYRFSIDDFTPPQNIDISVVLTLNGETLNQVEKTVAVTKYADITKERDMKDEFFRTVTDVKFKNIGNVAKTETYEVGVSFFRSLFTKTDPPADKIQKNGKRFLEWVVTLEPFEEYSLQMVTDYRLLIFSIAILLVVVVVYFINRSPLVLKKDALIVGSPEEGISEMKIILNLKNRSQDLVEHIDITEKVPRLATFEKESYLGTLEPEKILKHDKKGTLVKWHIASLEPFEERIISYKVKSKLNIVGGIKLPPGKLKFETKNGRERVIYSNRTEIDLRY